VLTAWLGGLPLSLEWNKAHLINHLAGVHGYRHYLELCTFMSGGRYDEIDRAKLPTCRRLMYRCPDDFDDGLAIDYRSSTLDIGECLTTIRQEGRSFDIVLVDSWHEFEPSWRDLVEAFRLIRADGMLVVHDCLPPRPEIAVPNTSRENGAASAIKPMSILSARGTISRFTRSTPTMVAA
jgi:hypothetical protein